MAKPLPFKGTKLSYMWRYRHGDTAAVVPDPGQQQPADLGLQDFVCTCQAGVHSPRTNLQFSNCHSLMDVLRYLFRKVQYPNVTAPSFSFAAKVGGNTVVAPGSRIVVFSETLNKLKYAGNGCPEVTDNGTFSSRQYTDPDGSQIVSNGSYNFTLLANAKAPATKTFRGTTVYATGTTNPQDNTGTDCQKTELTSQPQETYNLSNTANIKVDLPFYYGWSDDSNLSPASLSEHLFLDSTSKTFTIQAQSAANAKPKFFILIPPTHPNAQITLTNTSGNPTPAQLTTHSYTVGFSINQVLYGYSSKYFNPTEAHGIPLELIIKP